MIRNKDLDKLIKKCKNENDYKALITKGINEDIVMTDKQLLRIIKQKNEFCKV